MSMKPKIKQFFGKNTYYAVSGASNDPRKFGFKVTLWYVAHALPVIPVNPKSEEILGQQVIASVPTILDAIKSHKDIGNHKLSTYDTLSVSFLTPPHVTCATLKQIGEVEGYKDVIRGLWFQQGSYDQEVLDIAESLGLFERVVYQDECILVRGEEGLYSANL